MSTMILSRYRLRHALPSLLILAVGSVGAAAEVRSPYIDDLPGAQRYRAQVATDKAFMDIKQENFSSVPKMSFTGLKASFYHVRLSAYGEDGLEGETGVYDIFYYPPVIQAR